MNWYKCSQKQPKKIDSLAQSTYTLITPDGIIYDSTPSHDEWVEAFSFFLKKQYNIFLKKSEQISYFLYLKYKWIRHLRTYLQGRNYEYFDINSIHNTQALKIIEKELFKILQPQDKYSSIEILSLEDGREIHFDWTDFIQSGESFTNFVRSQIK